MFILKVAVVNIIPSLLLIFQALTLCAVLLFCYGLLSSLAPNFLWILFLRGLVGFAIGCVPQS